MRERHLYRGLSDFQGSIDEDGRLYDERHNFIGRIDGDDVYDYCNIRQGSIGDDGKLWDCDRNLVGQEHGNNFFSPSCRGTGLVRGDSFGEGRGSEYGALMMLKKRNRQYSGEILDGDYEFGNDYDGNDDDDGDGYDGDYDSNMDDGSDDDGWEESRPTTSSYRRAKRKYNDNSVGDDEGCSTAIGCLIFIIIGLFLLVVLGGS